MAEGGAMTVTMTPCLTTFAEELLGGPGISWCLWVSIFAVKPLGGEKQSKEVISDGCYLLREWKFPCEPREPLQWSAGLGSCSHLSGVPKVWVCILAPSHPCLSQEPQHRAPRLDVSCLCFVLRPGGPQQSAP